MRKQVSPKTPGRQLEGNFNFNFLQNLIQHQTLSFHLKSEQSVGVSPSPNTADGSADNDTRQDGASERRSRTREEFRRRTSPRLRFQDPLQVPVHQTLTRRGLFAVQENAQGLRGLQGRGRRGDATLCWSPSDADAVTFKSGDRQRLFMRTFL